VNDLKIPPHNIQAEQAIIGALILSPDTHWKVKGTLTLQDWYREAHGHIAQAILEAGCEMPAVVQHLTDSDLIERVGGADYLWQIASQVSTAAGIDSHIETVKECARRRELIRLCDVVSDSAYNRSSDETAGDLRRGLGEIETADRIRIVTASEAVNAAFKEIEVASKHDGSLIGLSSGFADLDWHTGGFRGGDIIVLGARPGMGKTVFAGNVAVRCGAPVLIFNLEMTARQLATRDMAGLAKVDFTKLRTGRLKDDDWARITRAAGKLSDKPIFFVDSGNITVENIEGITEKAHRKYGIRLLIIDYVQLVGGQGKTKREEFIAHISRSLKNLARDLDIPILALAQLNRQCEARQNKRPMLSDLRESGAIEQDADVVCFLYRESMYNKEADKNKAELIIAKGRNIQIGTIELVWQGAYQVFQDQFHV
jgi:replicative DNA helicase